MKKTLLCFCFAIAFMGITKKTFAQMATIDVATVTAIGSLTTQMIDQVETASKMLGVLEKTQEVLNKAGAAVEVIADVGQVISLSKRTIDDTKYLMEYIQKTKVTNPAQAVAYSGRCVYTIENVVKNINRIGKLLEDGFFNTDPGIRTQILDGAKHEIALAEGSSRRVRMEVTYKDNQRIWREKMLESQNIKVIK